MEETVWRVLAIAFCMLAPHKLNGINELNQTLNGLIKTSFILYKINKLLTIF